MEAADDFSSSIYDFGRNIQRYRMWRECVGGVEDRYASLGATLPFVLSPAVQLSAKTAATSYASQQSGSLNEAQE